MSQWNVPGQIDGLACGDVGGCRMCSDYFGIASDFKLVVGFPSVEDGEDGFAFMLTGENINSVPGDELCLRTTGDDFVVLPPVE